MKSLLSGHEVQLNEGAFGTLSEQILRLFTEAKRKQSDQDLDHIPIVSYYVRNISDINKNENKNKNLHIFIPKDTT